MEQAIAADDGNEEVLYYWDPKLWERVNFFKSKVYNSLEKRSTEKGVVTKESALNEDFFLDQHIS